MLPRLSLITGGARSGKSRFAETLVRRGSGPFHYIATAEAWDAEMRARIEAHRQDRGTDWVTHEAPLDLAGTLDRIRGGTVLVDCATLWLTNHMLAEHDLAAETEGLVAALARAVVPVVIVTNEVGWGIVPENALARRFRDEQGRLNQRLATEAGLAVLIAAGLPMVLKGALPGELG